jgi:hypothetical protein
MREFVRQQKDAAEGGVLNARITIGFTIKQMRKPRAVESYVQ